MLLTTIIVEKAQWGINTQILLSIPFNRYSHLSLTLNYVRRIRVF